MVGKTVTPTKAEAERIERMLALGCIVTRLRYGTLATAECHHIVDGERRLGHWYTLPLTPYYHRGVLGAATNQRDMIETYGASLAHGTKAFFESHRKTELDLWRIVQRMLGLDDALPPSKILPRRVA
jgi:hypothetical protein